MEKNNKNLNVPNLRFPEFSGEWDITTIGEISNIKNGPFGSVLHAEDYVSDGIPIVTTEHFKSGSLPIVKDGIPQVSEQDYIRLKGYKLQTNDIVFSRVGSVDINAYVSDTQNGWLFSGRVLRVRPISSVNSLCLHFVLSTEKVKQGIRSRAVGQTMPSINTPILSTTNIFLPKSLEEQRKISIFLALIDARFETQKKIIEDLKKLKDAIAEKLFCCPDEESPELRVENSSDRWNLYRLKDVCQRITERNSQESSSLVLTIAAQYGLVSQTDFFNKSVASENLSNYYLIRKGDFAYNKSYSGEYAWGAVKRLELYEKGVLSPLYICFRPNPLIVNSDFLSHYFETHKWHNGIAQIAGEGARNHGLLNISISDFFETIHRFPELPEQQRIASYLNSLSDKISLANKVLESYTRQKQYLLARMFI